MKLFRRKIQAHSSGRTALLLTVWLPCAVAAQAYEAVTLGYDMRRGMNMYAKVSCSAVFVSERDPTEALYNSGYVFLPPLRDQNNRIAANVRSDLEEFRIDRDDHTVTLVRQTGERATARYTGDQGCAVGMEDDFELRYEPTAVVSRLPPAAATDWPMGDRLPPGDPLAPGIRREIEAALDTAFSPGLLTHSFLVVHKGKIVAERFYHG